MAQLVEEKIQSKLVIAQTHLDLQNLKNSQEQLETLVVTDEASENISLIADVIEKHHRTLRSITLNSKSPENIKVDQATVLKLAKAIGKCSILTSFSMINYKDSFKDSIQFMGTRLEFLPQLNYLSFKNTILGSHVILLAKDIALSKNIKTIDLTNSILDTKDIWELICFNLSKSNSLEKIILNNTPISLHAVENLVKLVMNVPTITTIDWKPLEYYVNQIHFFELLNACRFTKQEWETSEWFAQHRNSFTEQLRSDEAKKEYAFAYNALEKLKEYSTERNQPKPTETLKLVLKDKNQPSLALIAAIIFLHRDSLKTLIITCESDEKNVSARGWGFIRLAAAIGSCHHLENLKLENFQGFFGEDVAILLDYVNKLPFLRKLELPETYLGEPGLETLVSLVAKNKVVELNLTNAGLINNCLSVLRNALKANTSIQRLKLGASPMRAAWLSLLTLIHTENPHREIEWQMSDPSTMSTNLFKMSLALLIGSVSIAEIKKSCEVFSKEYEKIQAEWKKFKDAIKPEPIFTRNHSGSGDSHEMADLSRNPSTRLLNGVRHHGYGVSSSKS